ncbi:MAG TPA: glycosyltransferase family 2 protein [Candidatus Mediterraneibacter stercoripullorum]|nr:glycosyltransferase family 2 protein [Candidatus Mediterraneibacter stercoripullorum]
MKKIALIVPCYNEQEVLPVFYQAIDEISAKMNAYEFSFIFVDDGSSDATLDILKNFSEFDPRVIYLSFSKNFGKEAAIYAGLVNAVKTVDYITVMDADMQDPPELLPEMVRYIEEEHYDSVATRRVSRKGEPPIRSFFARMFYRLMKKISDADMMDGARDYRLMTRSMAEAIVKMEEYNRFSKGLYGWVGFKTKWISFENVERAAGETKWSFWKLLKYSMDGIINFSSFPLRVSSWCGLFLTFVSVISIIFICVRKLLYGDPVSGWPSLVCIIVFIGGVQLFCIGVLGQYLSKMYLEIKKRPHFIIRESNRNDSIVKIS